MKAAISIFLSLLASTLLLNVEARRRSLTEITYRFTNCGSTNNDGPRINVECRPLYESVNSPIVAIPERLFQFENLNGEYDGAQGFRLPKNGLYNITIAGARGGEGVCNYEYGLGHVQRLQAQLTTDYEYLIMVGQRGTSVCDVEENADIPICQGPRPTTLEETQICNNTWYNYTIQSRNIEAYALNGGAGGGGASMIWARNITTKQFTSLPIVIAPGGGGGSAILNYDSFDEIAQKIDFSRPSSVVGPIQRYTFHLNAHFTTQYLLLWPEGVRGARPNGNGEQIFTSGSGGGWMSSMILPFLLPFDGKLLSQQNDFAEGGSDCSASAQAFDAHVFSGVFGGYGGGGGGCGSGGGGGGYTGGHVIANPNDIPGSGGDFGIFNDTFPVTLINHNQNDDDGFVEIVESNCECAGECEVFTEEGQFECSCPNGTLLAQDGSSCYQVQELSVEEGELVSLEDGVSARELRLSVPVGVVSVSVDVIVQSVGVVRRQVGEESDIGECVLVLLGDGLDQALLSETISESGTLDTLSVVSLDASGNVSAKSEAVSLLRSPVTVTTMTLISSAGDCRLANTDTIQANISIVAPEANPSTGINATVFDILHNILINAKTKEKATDNGVNVRVVIGSVLGVALFVAVILIVSFLVYYKNKRDGRKRPLLLQQLSEDKRMSKRTESLEFNAAYMRYERSPSQRMSMSLSNGYAALTTIVYKEDSMDDSLDRSTNNGGQFQPIHGIRTPSVDFCTYNRTRFHTNVRQWQYPRSNLTYMRELGEGQFGKVLLMKAKDIAGYKGKIPVAVKTLTSRDPDIIQKFVEEAELMKKFTHPNIVSLLGFIGRKEGEDSAPLMILEYMQYGDLHGFLVAHRPCPNKSSLLKKMHFITFAYDIACGLECLSSYKYVHRDVAARNCLVGPSLEIKIADFGLARGVNNKDYYRIAGSAVLPVRWMSPESLLLGKFSSASDVWSYGVTVWEILTFGKQPLPDMNSEDIVNAAQSGNLHHARPSNCSGELWELVTECHQCEEKRPSFEEIVSMELFNVVNERPHLSNSGSLPSPMTPDNEQAILFAKSEDLLITN